VVISPENIRHKKKMCIRVMVLALALTITLTACAVGQSDSGPTATPQRPDEREAIYTSAAQGDLNISLNELQLQALAGDPDTQVLIVLASGDTNPAFVLYPSNQPGIRQDSITLRDYPLRMDASAERVGLWAVALRHRAYPVAAAIGQQRIAEQLAGGFDQLVAQGSPPPDPLAQIVAGAGEGLLAWFGEIDVLGEVALELSAAQGWSAGENQVLSRDNGLALRYEVTFGAATETTPEMIPTLAASTEVAGNPFSFEEIPGYRQVLHEDFNGAQSNVEWFIGRDPTYSATIVNNAYQIVLETIDRGRATTTIWGSIQDMYFDNFIVRARMRVVQEDVLARYGLWLHYQDEFHFLFFGMENSGRYRAARFQNGYTELNPWTMNDIVNTGNTENLLEVLVQGDEFTIAVNGEPLVTVSDSLYADGRIAFFCYSDAVPTTCHLQEIAVWVPEDEPFPKPTATYLPTSEPD
jgi:hypothetical protein